MKLKVGQTLFMVKTYGGNRLVTVTKVGRKWATLNTRHRVNIETLIVDGGNYNSPGKCYLTEAEYRQKIELETTWEKLKNKLNWARLPEGITTTDILEAAKILKIDMDEL